MDLFTTSLLNSKDLVLLFISSLSGVYNLSVEKKKLFFFSFRNYILLYLQEKRSFFFSL